ncbi:hypothetical protein MD484_g1709, partial [Candolleomyces efflorescens]
MNTEGHSGSRKRGRFRQYLQPGLARGSLSNISISSVNDGDGASTTSGHSSLAQPTSPPQENVKVRKRDRFFNLFRGAAMDRPPSFKRSTLEKDISVLSMTYLMEDCPSLKELVLVIVSLSTKCQSEQSSQLVGKCANFCVCLIQYVESAEYDYWSAVDAAEEFSRAVKDIHSFDYNLESSVMSAEEYLDQSITAIKDSHPSLEDIEGRPHRGLSGTAVTLIDIGIPVVTILKDAIETIGAVPFLKPVLTAVLVISQAARQTQSNFDEMQSLSRTAGEFVISIAERCSTFQEIPSNLDDAVKKLERRLRAIALRCRDMGQKSFISCFFQNTTFKEELIEQSHALNMAIQEFQSTALIDIQDVLQKIAEAVHRTANNVESGRLKELPTHPDMSGILAEYLVESRTPDVEEVFKWIESSNELLLCIHGTAGVGKSTLAGHLSRELRSAGRLAGAVFLAVAPTDTSGPETIIKMLAHEIGRIHPRAIPKILEAIEECHMTSLDNHLQKFILEPLLSLGHSHPLVIIVDALDEWGDHPKFIQALGYLNSNASLVKVIGTIRLSPVASQMPGIGAVLVRTYHLEPLSTEVMKAYFEKHLMSVPWIDGRRAHPQDIDKLADLSGGLPVWAATVISLLSHRLSSSPPHEILAEIVGSRRQTGSSEQLAVLYQNALKCSFTTPETIKHSRDYLGAIFALQAPLSRSDFAEMSGIPRHLVENIQAALLALQTRSPPSGSEHMVHPATAIFHLSLIEHVSATGAENPFAISALESHSALGLHFLKQLSSLPPTFPNPRTRLRAIQDYAVKYWLYHVSNGTPRSKSAWSQTEHCAILQTLSPNTQQQWALLFYEATMPGDDQFELEPGDDLVLILRKLAYYLRQSDRDQWEFEMACLEVAVRLDDGDAEAWLKLGWSYRRRGERMGDLHMHEEALIAFRQALALRPESDPDHADSLNCVALALRSCYQLNGSRDMLDEAISIVRKAVPHSDGDQYLNTLALALTDRYDLDGDLQTLQEVISLYRKALELCLPPHPDRAVSLNNLAIALRSLHQHNRDLDPLVESISLYREALRLRPAPDPLRYTSLGNLATSLNTLYRRNADKKALDEAISLQYEALALCPVMHPDRSGALNNLALSLKARYERNGNIGTLDESISMCREVLGLVPAPHPLRPQSLRNLVNVLSLQFDEQDPKVEILDETISFCRELRILRPSGHRYREGDLNIFLHILQGRRKVTGEDQDYTELEDVRAELAAIANQHGENKEDEKNEDEDGDEEEAYSEDEDEDSEDEDEEDEDEEEKEEDEDYNEFDEDEYDEGEGNNKTDDKEGEDKGENEENEEGEDEEDEEDEEEKDKEDEEDNKDEEDEEKDEDYGKYEDKADEDRDTGDKDEEDRDDANDEDEDETDEDDEEEDEEDEEEDEDDGEEDEDDEEEDEDDEEEDEDDEDEEDKSGRGR